MSWQLAPNEVEAKWQHENGYGYSSREEALEAQQDRGVDSYYREIYLKLWEIKC